MEPRFNGDFLFFTPDTYILSRSFWQVRFPQPRDTTLTPESYLLNGGEAVELSVTELLLQHQLVKVLCCVGLSV